MTIEDEKLKKICYLILEKTKYADKYRNRLDYELNEIQIQMEAKYFLDLFANGKKFSNNENNLFIVKLLGLVNDFDIESSPKTVIGEFPDVDIDYIEEVRNYLRNEWIPKNFGKENICLIGNYTTFGIKSTLIDMARVHDKDRNEILAITTKIGLKDEDGKVLTWDKTLETYKELREYCEKNPEVAESAKKLLHRNRGSGVHAGGIIISNSRIDNLVPLVTGKDGKKVSAFVEGLHGTDLGPLGLIKFDMLNIATLKQIAISCKLIKERHCLKSICALEGQSDWSNTDYLEDKIALSLASEGKLKCIFQFDSPGIRDLAKKGGITCFEDLVALSALYRPGPMGMGMHINYINRKTGKESFETYPILHDILKNTYGVLVYQEQILKILKVVGNIPEIHVELIRKAISKKKSEIFLKYKDMFIKNGMQVLSCNEEEINKLWDTIEAFSEYGFNKSHSVAYTYMSSRSLWLKAHYPLEFFAATLSCEDKITKIKEYKIEAENMGLQLKSLSLNNSKDKFSICDNIIYMGFSNVKGIGSEVALQIYKNQPYTDLQDFMEKNGTDSRVLEPLISLRIFSDSPKNDFEYYLYYKSVAKKIDSRNKRFEIKYKETLDKITVITGNEEVSVDLVKDFLSKNYSKDQYLSDDFLDKLLEFKVIGEGFSNLYSILSKYKKSSLSNELKNENNDIIPYKDYKFTGNIIVSKEKDQENYDFLDKHFSVIENKHYGFSWQHMIENSKDYAGGFTFDDFEENEETIISMVEGHIVDLPIEKVSKGKGIKYYFVGIEDANSRKENIIFWEDDYKRFKEELNFWEDDTFRGNFIKVRLKKPDNGFSTYSFESPPKNLRHIHIPKEKENDYRLIVMDRSKNKS